MDRYKSISQLSNAFGVALGVILANISTNWLNQYSPPLLFSILFMLIVVGVSFQLTIFIFNTIFDRLKILRRLLLGHQYVEGTWIVEVFSNNNLMGIGITRFESANNSLRWSGLHYDLEGNIKGAVSGQIFELKWPLIKVYIHVSSI